MSLPRQLYRADDVRELDRRAIEQLGIPAGELMERAGRALYRVLRERLPAAGRVFVLCGGGNNGGDGYVVARIAREAGLAVTLVSVVAPQLLSGAAAAACDRFMKAGGQCERFSIELLRDCDVVIDALLGTGLDRAVAGEFAEIIRAVNSQRVPVVSADLPSGLHADTGKALGVGMQATFTVSFIGLKAGMFTGQGRAHSGEIIFDALDVPGVTAAELVPLAQRLEPCDLFEWLPRRARDSHKGDFGHVVIVGGGEGMPGAVRLAGEAALRSGAGRVSALVSPGNVAAIAGQRPELMCRCIYQAVDAESIFGKAGVIAIGPGLGQDDWANKLWASLRERDYAKLPRVLDADALNWLAREPFALTPADMITPHPGEAARLLNCSVVEIEADRFTAARELAERFNCTVVLKGSGTLIAAPGGRLALCDRGNPGMATAGTGDVLTGLVAGLRAQGLAAFDAACAGVLAHALAGDRAAKRGERGMLAGDLLDELRPIMNPFGGSGSP